MRRANPPLFTRCTVCGEKLLYLPDPVAGASLQCSFGCQGPNGHDTSEAQMPLGENGKPIPGMTEARWQAKLDEHKQYDGQKPKMATYVITSKNGEVRDTLFEHLSSRC